MKKGLLMLAIAASGIANAQYYTLSSFEQNYQPLVNPTIYSENANWIDPDIQVSPAFDVRIGEAGYNELFLLGSGAEWGGFSSTTTGLMGFGNELFSGSNIPGAPGSEIAWKTDGNDGNRIFKIQYTDAAFNREVFPPEGNGSANNRISFQLWFYEVDGAIEFRFGPRNITDPELIFDGEQGPLLFVAGDMDTNSGSIGAGAVIGGDPANPEMTNVTDLFDIFFSERLSGVPANGQVYRLAPASLSSDDKEQLSFSIYPTIVADELTIKTPFQAIQQYRIYSITGSIVNSGILNGNRINVSELPSGMYLVSVDGSKALKFIKE